MIFMFADILIYYNEYSLFIVIKIFTFDVNSKKNFLFISSWGFNNRDKYKRQLR